MVPYDRPVLGYLRGSLQGEDFEHCYWIDSGIKGKTLAREVGGALIQKRGSGVCVCVFMESQLTSKILQSLLQLH